MKMVKFQTIYTFSDCNYCYNLKKFGHLKYCCNYYIRPWFRSSLIWVYTVWPDLPVRKFRIIYHFTDYIKKKGQKLPKHEDSNLQHSWGYQHDHVVGSTAVEDPVNNKHLLLNTKAWYEGHPISNANISVTLEWMRICLLKSTSLYLSLFVLNICNIIKLRRKLKFL